MSRPKTVRAWTEDIILPTFLPAAPDLNPMFLEKRVYQGSSGRVYPLPFIDRISESPRSHRWKGIWLENEYLRALVLPEIGGRIHVLQDKTNGYDLVYRQPVIKPALVGLAGPWISGGIEFNWPQHHRPATFLPVDTTAERHADGSVTVWCSDHDPMARMKGMHGICLHPGQAGLELKVRAYNRTPFVQTFLWWANVAVRVHEGYQSFFPPDVSHVADHARRAMSEYPLAQGHYYGVDYGQRGRRGVPPGEVPSSFVPPHCNPRSNGSAAPAGVPNYTPNDLSFYANIPVPTSYMCLGSAEDFFGGYDHRARAGLVHLACHHIAPGKKQWTWGNHEFGCAWDRNLTEPDAAGQYGPYIELMAGVFTDNQPDFSFLQPGETKTWSQFWYPIQKIGPAQHANLEAAVSLRSVSPGHRARLGVSVTRRFSGARLTLWARHKTLFGRTLDLAPGRPFVTELSLPRGVKETELRLRVTDRQGCDVVSYQPQPCARTAIPAPATEPPAPQNVSSADELYITGLHLEQYRHATRCPALYWREALRRDPLDARCNNRMGLWHLRRGEFTAAEAHFRRAIQRLTRRNANPYDGEPFYNLGLCLRCQDRDAEAYDAFYKATWNQAWAAAACHALAETDCARRQWSMALEHLDRSLALNTDNLRARNLKVMALREAEPSSRAAPRGSNTAQNRKRMAEAATLLRATRALDPLDWWARHLAGEPLACDSQTLLDLVLDVARAGFQEEALGLLEPAALAKAHPSGSKDTRGLGTAPLVHYYRGWLHTRLGRPRSAHAEFRKAAAAPPDYCFPARLDEIAILETAMRANPKDARAPYYLGNLFYDRRRHREAIRLWEQSARLDPNYAVVWRNLGLGYYNILRQPARACAAYEKAFRANPADARLLYERDQLWKRIGKTPVRRLRELEGRLDLVRQRDDLSVELCALYNQAGRHPEALQWLRQRHFQPWEGGEGGPLGQHVRSNLGLGRRCLRDGQAVIARRYFEAALTAPHNLGEAKHLLANQSDVFYWLGCACQGMGDRKAARRHWTTAATCRGDFQGMSVRAFSEMTYYSALAWQRLGKPGRARTLLRDLLAWAQELQKSKAGIDYFATSLPAMLLFEDDIQARQVTTALFLQAQAWLGLGRRARAKALLQTVLRRDPNHPAAADLRETLT